MPAHRSRSPLALWALFCVTLAGESAAALPRNLEREFTDRGIPLDAVAVVVQDTRAPRPVLSHRATAAMVPGSVIKLVTSFVALETLGARYRWHTEAHLGGALVAGVLQGDLILKGRGDPKITVEQWQSFMATLRARGIERIEGDLVLDRSHFALPVIDPAQFDGAPLRPYNVTPDALLVNFKTVRFTFTPQDGAGAKITVEPPLVNLHVTGAPREDGGRCNDWRAGLLATFDDRRSEAYAHFAGVYPSSCGERSWWVSLLGHGDYVHAMFTTYFRAAGGVFAGRWRDGSAPRGAAPFAVLESPPLYDIVRDINKLSNNVMARQVFLTLATTVGPPPATPGRAATAVRIWLRDRALSMPELVLDNGSGLSRSERISAGSLARLLLAADRSALREEFASSLAVAAIDGTVERRFQDQAVAGQALLKTGTLDGVRGFAGYVLGPPERRMIVVTLVNHPRADEAQPALDALVQWAYRRVTRVSPADFRVSDTDAVPRTTR